MRKSIQKGLTMLELLIVMAIIAVIAAIATANYFIGLTRAKQKRTVADMRLIAIAWEARAVDVHSYQTAGYTFPTGAAIPYQSIKNALVPTYTRTLPEVDGWLRKFDFAFVPGEGSGSYAIRSPGRDGAYDATIAEGTTHDPDCDIIYADGQFVTYPDTVQGR